MSTLQQHITLIANLLAQLRELDRLREQVRGAELRDSRPRPLHPVRLEPEAA
jgi:hypothetical protein